MNKTYRDEFVTSGAGALYDSGQYKPGSYWDVVWKREQQILDDVIAELCRPITYLDFACGTGRILGYVTSKVDDATGVDVSEDMLERARSRAPRANVICADLTADSRCAAGPFDLVTAFRFVLNAEYSLRVAAVRSLAARLKGRGSRLVINCHGNRLSYKMGMAPLHWLKRRLGKRVTERVMWPWEMEELLKSAGLEIVAVHGMAVLPPRILSIVPLSWRGPLEDVLSRLPATSRFGVNQVYVCRPRV